MTEQDRVEDQVWHQVATEDAIAEGQATVHAVNGWQVLLTRFEDDIVAVNDRCTHAAARLSTGRIRRGALMCPLHGARFDLADGRCIGGAYPTLRRFPVRVANGVVEVAVPATPPGMDETPVELPG
ncbi:MULTISPECIES: Rieske (2Fe-2S) protein [unclassified Novosphingobium]|uniref:Rieske (2Fe-2S) protein n=1 Tax=Novosphingobium TaxID=165696 RepID=UPI001446371E|nr:MULTISPECIES: Rieske (2Fe-2S) protein [unclassified Novosphingobium]NKJ44334.1 nitrite reductase/ring-hydroxylating ferredoxin subunit [Novosphingobium sp. SG720]NMN05209.1 nitrite reductase/ring-hydroxylating ferredoxin subunit [Novosphingobium sp. SG919]NMN87504.1 nitrite reductase/ring-hydroxylating ferredoxin subunit [Novosphingobium sp. SG916]